MELAKLHTKDGVQTLTLPKNFMFSSDEGIFIGRVGNSIILTPELSTDNEEIDETEYLFSKPSVARDILEGLATSWENCIPEAEALA